MDYLNHLTTGQYIGLGEMLIVVIFIGIMLIVERPK